MSATTSSERSSSYLTSRQQRLAANASSSSVTSVEYSSNGKQQDVIGFYHIPDQIQRKVIKKGFDFTLIVAGESGLGKSTFINTMFIQDLYKDRATPLASDLIKRTVQIEKRSVEIEEFGIKLRLTVVDTPGFGDALDNSDSWKHVRDYIEQQYESYFQAESSVNRRNIQDSRVHCCIYFIPPNGYGLHKLDIEFMKHLQDLVNIVPVIAKADTLTANELQRLKEKVKRDIAAHQIEVYDYAGQPLDPDEADDATKRWNRELQDMVPFAVIGGNSVVEVGGRKIRARSYPWGVIEIDNTRHCDFAPMREMLVSTHMQDLKDRTVDVHYENYRARRLVGANSANIQRHVIAVKPAASATQQTAASKLATKATAAQSGNVTPAQQVRKTAEEATASKNHSQQQSSSTQPASQPAQSKTLIYKVP